MWGLGEPPLPVPGPLLTFAIPNEEAELTGFRSLLEQSMTLQQLSGQRTNAKFCFGVFKGAFLFPDARGWEVLALFSPPPLVLDMAMPSAAMVLILHL